MSNCFDGENAATGEILNNVIRLLPGVPESEARQYIHQALRDFARASEAWQFKDYEAPVCAGDQLVELDADAGIEVRRVDRVLVADNREGCGGCHSAAADVCWRELPPGDETLCAALQAGCGCDQPPEWMLQAWQETGHQRGQVRFARPWAGPARLRFHLTLIPAEGSDTFPPHLLADNRRAIEAGALGFGYMIPGQDWSNPERALFYTAKWMEALATARAERERQKLLARLDLRPGRPTYRHEAGYAAGHRSYIGGHRQSAAGSRTACEPGCC
ncbi:MAG: hypothetical protein KDI44_02615 [Thiothrix sp.]|nr:hypothetical protein [Thiothrix sp.]HPQ94188.1 hypothetical protein [Thiolinea sp.]